MGVNRYLGGVITANQNPPTVESASGTWTLEEAYQNIGNWPMALNTVYDSLKFNSADSAYLSRTPTVAGNRRTWTWSGWVKISGLGTQRALFSANNPGSESDSTFFKIDFSTSNLLQVSNYSGDLRRTTQVFRDVGAWYHIVVSFDTTQATADNRIKIYVNGSQVTAFDATTNPSQNAELGINATNPHDIGRVNFGGGYYYSGYLTEINFIDGLALDADYFGFFDANGIWQPRAYKGAYGTNGFYLPMRESATASGFSTVTYTGTGSTNNVTGAGLAPDFVWIKNRSTIQNHLLVDIVRGADKRLSSSTTAAEATITDGRFTSFNSDGFTVAADDLQTNYNGDEFVGWCWDAGTSTVTNNDGTITSTVRANQTYGISVITYTGTGSAMTFGHGLGSTPEFFIIKYRNAVDDWFVYHTSLGLNQSVLLNSTSGAGADSGFQSVSATTIGIGVSGGRNTNGGNYVCYAFSEVSGFSKFGSYTGNGSATGPTITTGFRPGFVMIKRSSGVDSWFMYDGTRDPGNPVNLTLQANTSNAEDSTVNQIDFLDTGFQCRSTNTATNQNGETYIYMAFADTRAYSAFDDYSGNGNNWQPNNIGTDDVYVDVPTNWGTDTGVGGEVRGNYCTWNALDRNSSGTLANGNLNWTSGTTAHYGIRGTISPTSGKWYFEVVASAATSASIAYGIGMANAANPLNVGAQSNTGAYLLYGVSSSLELEAAGVQGSTISGASIAAGDVIQVAYDVDASKLWVGKNNTWYNSSGGTTGDPATGANPSFSSLLTNLFPFVEVYNTTAFANFGQIPFRYTAPSGFKALCTQNLPEPTIADGGLYMNALTYTGNNTASRVLTGVGFQPDWVWIKERSEVRDNVLFDAVRGAGKALFSNLTAAEDTDTASMLSAFNSDGFTVGQSSYSNANNQTYVAWNWKANGAGSSNTAGTISSTVSANTTAGFSIVTYTGNGSAGATVGHGLSAQPSMMFVKWRDGADDWCVYNKNLSTSRSLWLNSTSAQLSSGYFGFFWNNTDPTSSVFTLGSNGAVNGSGRTYVAYCFSAIAGYSAFGSYTGNGSSAGPFVFTGFRPRYLLVKRTDSTAGWVILDTARDTYNATQYALQANQAFSEGTLGAYPTDIVSNGFKIRNDFGDFNASGGTFIYAAFAENPFKLSRAR